MKKQLLLGLSLSLCTSLAQADYLDVLAFKLKPACSLKDFIVLNQQMNEWGKPYNLTGEVVVPVFSETPDGYAWVGRTPDASTFGKAWDAWRAGVISNEEPVSKLNARWTECTTVTSRRGFDSY